MAILQPLPCVGYSRTDTASSKYPRTIYLISAERCCKQLLPLLGKSIYHQSKPACQERPNKASESPLTLMQVGLDTTTFCSAFFATLRNLYIQLDTGNRSPIHDHWEIMSNASPKDIEWLLLQSQHLSARIIRNYR